jgi:hypothetical protein
VPAGNDGAVRRRRRAGRRGPPIPPLRDQPPWPCRDGCWHRPSAGQWRMPMSGDGTSRRANTTLAITTMQTFGHALCKGSWDRADGDAPRWPRRRPRRRREAVSDHWCHGF